MKRGIDADLELTFDDGTLWVHSSVLVLGSIVFKSMLSSGTKEETGWKIKLPGKSMSTFQIFYNMLHTETVVPLTEKNMWVVAELANEYQTLNLLQRVLVFIEEDGLTTFNLAHSYANAIRFGFGSVQRRIESIMAIAAYVFDFFYDDYVFKSLPDEIHENLRLHVVRVVQSVPAPNSTDQWKARHDSFSTKDKCKAVLRLVTNYHGLPNCAKNYSVFVHRVDNIDQK